MKKTFIVKFPIKQEFLGLSWAQINELSWVEINLLSWREIAKLARRYLTYSIQFTRKLAQSINFTTQKQFSPPSFTKKFTSEILFTLKKVLQVR